MSESIRRQIGTGDIDQVFARLCERQRDFEAALRGFEANLQKLATSVGRASALSEALQSIKESLVPSESFLRLGKNLATFDLSLRPYLAFREFAPARVLVPKGASEAFRANTLEVVAASSRLLHAVTRGSELGGLIAPSKSGPTPQLPSVNLFRVLDRELSPLDLDDAAVDVDAAVGESTPGVVAHLGTRLVQLVYNVNTEAERGGTEAVFKPTTKTMLACNVLPTLVRCPAQSFGEDKLEFLLADFGEPT